MGFDLSKEVLGVGIDLTIDQDPGVWVIEKNPNRIPHHAQRALEAPTGDAQELPQCFGLECLDHRPVREPSDVLIAQQVLRREVEGLLVLILDEPPDDVFLDAVVGALELLVPLG